MLTLPEFQKIDAGLTPQTVNNTNVTGRYLPLANYRDILAVMHVSSMAATKTAKIELLQATDRDGTNSKAVTDAEATLTANTLVYKATVACSSVIATDALSVNEKTYTVVASSATLADGEVNVGGSNTLMAEAFATAINDSNYGVPGVTASADSGTLTLESTDGETAITVSTDDATMTLATLEAWAYVSLQSEQIDVINGFTFVAPKVTTTSNSIVGVTMLRGNSRYGVTQAAGASAIV